MVTWSNFFKSGKELGLVWKQPDDLDEPNDFKPLILKIPEEGYVKATHFTWAGEEESTDQE